MSTELAEGLYAKYPALMARRPGLDVGDGWYDFIHALCETLENSRLNGHPAVEVTEVFAKFSQLRVFASPWPDDYQLGLIDRASILTTRTCEVCGSSAIRQQARPLGRVVGLCETHLAKYRAGQLGEYDAS